jgi:hypothetical protein
MKVCCAALQALINNNGYQVAKMVRARLLHDYLCELCGYAGYPTFTKQATRQRSLAAQVQPPKNRRKKPLAQGRGEEGMKEAFVPFGGTLSRVTSQQVVGQEGIGEQHQDEQLLRDRQGDARGSGGGSMSAFGSGVGEVAGSASAGQDPGGSAAGGSERVDVRSQREDTPMSAFESPAASGPNAAGDGDGGEVPVQGDLHMEDGVQLDMGYVWENAPIGLLLQVRCLGRQIFLRTFQVLANSLSCILAGWSLLLPGSLSRVLSVAFRASGKCLVND